MATKKNNAGKGQKTTKANSSKKSATNTSRKAATDNTAKAAMSEPEVLETVECVDLTMYTKNHEIRTGEGRKGKLQRLGKYDYRFDEEGTREREDHPWERHEKLAEDKPYARISANCNGGFMGVYVPRTNFKTNREFLERLLDQAELLIEKMDGVDTVAIIDKKDAQKREFLGL